jgi:hypothetical protein
LQYLQISEFRERFLSPITCPSNQQIGLCLNCCDITNNEDLQVLLNVHTLDISGCQNLIRDVSCMRRAIHTSILSFCDNITDVRAFSVVVHDLNLRHCQCVVQPVTIILQVKKYNDSYLLWKYLVFAYRVCQPRTTLL